MNDYSEVIDTLVKKTINDDFFREVKLGSNRINVEGYINMISSQLIDDGFYKIDNVSFLGIDKNTEEYLRFTLEQIFIQLGLNLKYIEYDEETWSITITDRIQFSKYMLDLNIMEMNYIVKFEELFIKNLKEVIKENAERLLTVFIQEEVKPRLRYAIVNSQVQLEVGYSEDIVLIDMIGSQLFNYICNEVNTELPGVNLTSNVNDDYQVIVFKVEYK